MKLNSKVVYKLVREIAKKLEKDDHFEKDPELYVIGMLVAARDELKPGRTIGGVLEEACFEDHRKAAAKLLHRKKVAAH